MKGVTFGAYHSYDDFSLILSSKEIAAPKTKTLKIDIEGADSAIDLTDFFGEPKYEDCTHKFQFSSIVPQSEFLTQYSTIKNAIHGKKLGIILDDDSGFFYVGRCYVSSFTSAKGVGTIAVECDCEPWKYKATKTVIKKAVNGEDTIVLTNLRKRVVPEVLIEADSALHIVYETYNIWDLGSGSYTGVATSQSYTIPQSWLNAIPSATSGTATVTVTTYSGSTKIGSAVSKNFTVTVPASVVPTISSVAVADTSTAVYNHFGSMVQNKSKPKFTITAAGAYSSTIKTYKTVFEGKSYSGATPTAAVITGSGTVTATITVTDSRGRTASTTKSWTVIAYTAPKIISFQGFRCLSDGTENYEGTYLNAAINFSISPVSQKNTAAYTVEYKLQSATTWTTLTSGAVYALNDNIISASAILGVDNSFDIRLSVTDYFGTVRSTFEIPTAFTLLDFNASGKGIAFGKVSELSEGIEFALKTAFSHAETPSSVTYLTDGQDLNDILEPGFYAIPTTAISGTLVNKPFTGTSTGSLVVLREGNGVQKTQILHVASKVNGAIYERCYYSGAWGDWNTVYNGGGKILWEGGMYMTATHKITLPEAISVQPTGIVLVFSRYDNGAVAEHNYNSFFVPKAFVVAKPGVGSAFRMNTVNFSVVATKYLYINDTTIAGNDSNDDEGTGNGVTFNNKAYVLRYVIGV